MSVPLSILAWNLRHGGGARNMPRIILGLLEHNPDLIILSEFRRTTGGQIAGALADHGWIHQHSTVLPSGSHGPGQLRVDAREDISKARPRPFQTSLARESTPLKSTSIQSPNGLLIASRIPFDLHRTEHPLVLCPRAAAAAQLRFTEIRLEMLHLIAAHIPCAGPDQSAREHVFQCLVNAARRNRDTPCLIIGDLNAGRHHLDEARATFNCTRLFGQLAALGYRDAWRAMNPDSREFSWYSPEGAGFRLDHAIISQPLSGRLTCCRYSHSERQMGLSDHSALLLSLAPGCG